TLQRRTTRRTRMDAALRFALERGALALVYQRKVALADGRLKGFEQLMRRNSPEYGDISPEDFIPIAESSGQMVSIGMWALEQACRQMRDWQARYPAAREMTLAVNVSMRQLLQATIHADVAALLARTKVDPASIE